MADVYRQAEPQLGLVNPYAAPQGKPFLDSENGEIGVGVWRDGKLLVVQKGALVPDRCIRCNAPAEGRRLHRQLYWHHPMLYCLYFFGGPIVYALAAVCVRQQIAVDVGICRRHNAARMRSILACWLIALVSLAVIVIDILESNPLPFVFLIALLVFLLDLCYAARLSRLVVAERIDADYAWIKKVHPAYLDELPSL